MACCSRRTIPITRWPPPTRAYLLRDGTRVGEGPVADVLTLEKLSALYGASVRQMTDAASGTAAFLPDSSIQPTSAVKTRLTSLCVSFTRASSEEKSGASPARAITRCRSTPAVSALKPVADAEPQDLRQIVIEPRRGAQDLGLRLREHAEPCGILQHLQRRHVEDFRLVMRMHELEILRDEVDIDHAAGCVFEIPMVALALFLRDRGPACRQHRAAIAAGSRRRVSTS